MNRGRASRPASRLLEATRGFSATRGCSTTQGFSTVAAVTLAVATLAVNILAVTTLAVTTLAVTTLAVIELAVARPAAAEDPFAQKRRQMVEHQIEHRGITDPGVLRAMDAVPRHLFSPADVRAEAYDDRALPIGRGETILQPYLVALMTELLELDSDDRVLEIGTGLGYQAAVMSRLAGEVYTIEIVDNLATRASETLSGLGYDNVHVRLGDGYQGWPEAAPFDAILVTAATSKVPPPLLAQLKVGGRMVIPVGDVFQDLQVITKTPDGDEMKRLIPVRFGPMTGTAQDE